MNIDSKGAEGEEDRQVSNETVEIHLAETQCAERRQSVDKTEMLIEIAASEVTLFWLQMDVIGQW